MRGKQNRGVGKVWGEASVVPQDVWTVCERRHWWQCIKPSPLLFIPFKLKRLTRSVTRRKSQSPSTITLLSDWLISVSLRRAWEEAICRGVGVTPTDDSPLVRSTWPNVAGMERGAGQTLSAASNFETASLFIYGISISIFNLNPWGNTIVFLIKRKNEKSQSVWSSCNAKHQAGALCI